MKIDPDDFRAPPGKAVRLRDWPTRVRPFYKSQAHYDKVLEEHVEKMRSLQDMLYAGNTYSVLLVFQAMDAAGKDGAIKHVMSGVNPQGCQVFSFKKPSAAELDHDFLWRSNACLPERGRIGIFNRSYYEEVLIVRVHRAVLDNEDLPREALDPATLWPGRYRSITELEEHLHRNGTQVVKFFLHLSKGEQRKRFIARIDDPSKNWKFSQADIAERAYWKRYMRAYEECIGATSTKHAPWFIVPADDKENARLIVSRVIVDLLKDLDLSYPKVGKAHRKELLAIRRRLSPRKGA
jgi:PPK2 family polyphosphate:nucleotide phosphotransferase